MKPIKPKYSDTVNVKWSISKRSKFISFIIIPKNKKITHKITNKFTELINLLTVRIYL